MSKLEESGIQVVGISYDSQKILARFAKRNNITFPLLSDKGSKVIDAYGIRNQSRSDGLPHPGTFLLSAEGKVMAKLFYEGYRNRHTSQEIINAAKK